MQDIVDQYRRAAHTSQFGKSKEQAVAEFKEVAAEVYRQNGESIPTSVVRSPIELSSGDTQVGAVTPAGDLHEASRLPDSDMPYNGIGIISNLEYKPEGDAPKINAVNKPLK